MSVPIYPGTCVVMFTLLVGCADDPAEVSGTRPEPDVGIRTEFKPEPLKLDRATPISVEQAVRYVLRFQPGWKVRHIDQKPRVIFGDQKGYRFSIVRRHRRYGIEAQLSTPPQPTDFVDDVWEFVLIDDDGSAVPADAKNTIDWSDDWRPSETQPINLGHGYGFRWFTNATLKDQHKLRPLLNLSGGDNALALIVAGMQSNRFFTRQDCSHILPTFGDQALPHLKRLLTIKPLPPQYYSGPSTWLELVVGAIASIRTPKATELLVSLYESGTHELKREAARGLSRRPYRPEAKEVYLQMLAERTQNGEASYECGQACVEFNWTEAIPLFERVRIAPKSLRSYRDAVFAIRRLSGKPAAASLDKALRIIYAPDPSRREGQQRINDLAWAKQVLTTSDDYTLCILHAIGIYTYREFGKGGMNDKQRADSKARVQLSLEILSEMPRDRTLADVKRLANLLPRDVQLQELVEHLSEK